MNERPRDPALERMLTEVAARAMSLPDDGGLSRYAESRTRPGGIRRLDRQFDVEAAEELADCRNYLVWGVQEVYDAHLAGDVAASDTYERRMRCLAAVIAAWRELHTDAA